MSRLIETFDFKMLNQFLYVIRIFTLYSKSLPLDVASRVWDVFCRDGDVFLFSTALGKSSVAIYVSYLVFTFTFVLFIVYSPFLLLIYKYIINAGEESRETNRLLLNRTPHKLEILV